MTERIALPDVNVLLALVATQHEHHGSAHRWFTAVTDWATTPFTEAGLIRLMMNPAVVGGRLSGDTALDILTRLRAQAQHRFLADDTSLTRSHIELSALVGHRQVTDLHLVNLAASAGAIFTTFDARLVASLATADRHHTALIPV